MRGEFVDVGGRRLYYFAAGSRGAGEPVLFLHGFPGSSHLWHTVVPLMPPGHRLIVADQLGAGRSDGPGSDSLGAARAGADVNAMLTVNAHADRALALLDNLNAEQACVVGHGAGGAVATALALRAPERVSRLCLVNAMAFDSWLAGAARLARAYARTPLARLSGAGLLAGLVHSPALRGFSNREDGRRALDQFLLPYTQRLGVEALSAQLCAMRDPTVADQGAQLAAIRQPTSVVWGAHDPWLSLRAGARLCDAIPAATLQVIAGARHMTPIDAPERVAAAITTLLQR